MISNNKFFLKNLKNIFFLGSSPVFDELIKFNKNKKIKTTIITSSDQAKGLKKYSPLIYKKVDKNFKKKIKSLTKVENTLFISLGARWIFKKSDINKFFLNNLINFHGTRLPYNKGGATISWRILQGDKIENQLVHLVDGGIDTGPILYSEKKIVSPECKTPKDYIDFYNKNFLTFYKSFISKILKKEKFNLINQSKYIGTYFPRLNKEISSWLDWNMDSLSLIRFINAFDEPYNGAKTFINNKTVYIKKAHLHANEPFTHPYSKGLVSRNDKKWLVVNSIDSNSILIEKILDKKGNNLLNKIKAGSRFYTPTNKLDQNYKKKILYTSRGLKIV